MLNFLFTQTPLKFMVQDIWRDEAFSYLLAKKNIFEIIILSAKDFNPPLYYFILNFWIIFFGKSEIALRSLSLVFFCLTLYIVYLFLINILKIKKIKATLYLLLFIINPILNYYAFEARMYMMLAFLVTLSFYALVLNKKKLYLLSAILGIYTHYFMVFVIAIQLIYVLIEKHKEKISFFIKDLAIIIIAFMPILISNFLQKKIDSQFWIAKPRLTDIIYLPSTIFTGFETDQFLAPSLLIIISLTLITIFITSYSILKIKDKNKYLILFLLWSFFTPISVFFISFIKPIFLARYFIFSTVGLLLLIIYIIEHKNTKLQLLLLSFLVILTLTYNQIQIKYRNKDKIGNVISQIKNQMKAQDVLYVTNDLHFHTAEYYLDENRVFIYGKDYNDIAPYIGKVLIPKNKVTSILPVYPKRAFVLKQDLSYKIESLSN